MESLLLSYSLGSPVKKPVPILVVALLFIFEPNTNTPKGPLICPSRAIIQTTTLVRSVLTAQQNLVPYVEPNVGRDDLDENRAKFITTRPVLIKTDFPSVFMPSDMPYLKERYRLSNNTMLSTPREGDRADSPCDGRICSYEIAFKLVQTSRYLYEAALKVDNAFKKKAVMYSNIVTTNKTLEEDNLHLKQVAVEVNKATPSFGTTTSTGMIAWVP
ncbi:hypothetical protein FNV43_RR17114 [Rhamnella rubrinervis]|uniref:Uncharacterized protein n=1 Tax=Rhamnella rubrinervis TaxID=2594499 RepID=A0A8K0E305_9ROSA|nr:hypothetical protein FNV43_RR17114 [Rhamnella rubrinervis]